jgi:rubredoxin
MKKYECNGCGWIYDPELGDLFGDIEPGTPFSTLSNHWACPMCGEHKYNFDPKPVNYGYVKEWEYPENSLVTEEYEYVEE